VSARASIDLNADVGEGAGTDGALVPLVSSVNISCGAHAGDERSMREAILLAQRHGVAIGAHPGFEDRENFGRTEIAMSPAAAAALVIEQTTRLEALARGLGATVGHIKLHGALYNMAARDPLLAAAIARAVADHRAGAGGPAVLFALAGSVLVTAGRKAGLSTVGEGFADRTYRNDGTLLPRSEQGAMIEDPADAARQALGMAADGLVLGRDGSKISVDVETICVHGDSPAAVASARAIRALLGARGVSVRPAY
jgi:UPF0271 protein